MAIYSEFSHEKLWFSIVTLVYQRVYYVYKESTIDSFSTLEMRVENKDMFVSTEKLPLFTAILTGWDRSTLPNTITITSRKLRKKKIGWLRIYTIYTKKSTRIPNYISYPHSICVHKMDPH